MALENDDYIICFDRDLTGYWYRFLLLVSHVSQLKEQGLLNDFLQITCK